MMELSHQAKERFLEALWGYYAAHARNHLPWRIPDSYGIFDPYKIMVSELMLQQTQVSRVVPKFEAFLAEFPTVASLATVELGDVLRMWQGLGYNRRAKFLWQAAQSVYEQGEFPNTLGGLIGLPGVGVNTAGAILAYAYNQPVVFIETNVRTVFIHHFFTGQAGVADTEIRALLEQTLDHEQPREFYWALMDYGTHLKTTVGNANKASKHYAKQSKFEGSRRQLRGQVIRLLGDKPYGREELLSALDDERSGAVLEELRTEGLITETDGRYHL